MNEENKNTVKACAQFNATTIASVLSLEYLDAPKYGTNVELLWKELKALVSQLTGIQNVPQEIVVVLGGFLRKAIFNQHPSLEQIRFEILGEQVDVQDVLNQILQKLGISEKEMITMSTVPKEEVKTEIKRLRECQLLSSERTLFLLKQLE